jgi:hypothetical protein
MKGVVNISFGIELEDLAEQISWSAYTPEHIIEFILTVDALEADVNFTKQLIKKLQEAVDAEG